MDQIEKRRDWLGPAKGRGSFDGAFGGLVEGEDGEREREPESFSMGLHIYLVGWGPGAFRASVRRRFQHLPDSSVGQQVRQLRRACNLNEGNEDTHQCHLQRLERQGVEMVSDVQTEGGVMLRTGRLRCRHNQYGAGLR